MKKLIILLPLSISFASYSASFDCTKAASGTEKTICSIASLSSLDDQMANLYRSVRAKTPDTDKLKSEQIAWIKDSRRCGTDPVCIETAYKKRIFELETISGEKKPASAIAPTSSDFIVTTKSGDREVIYDKNSIIRSGSSAQMLTGVNFNNSVKFDNISGIYSMTTLSHFDCIGKKGRNSKGFFYGGKNASGPLLSSQTSSEPFADISNNPGLMNLLKLACGI